MLDGLEVTLVAVVGSLLTSSETLGFSSVEIGTHEYRCFIILTFQDYLELCILQEQLLDL